MCFEFVVKLSMCAPFVDCMQAKSDVRLQNHIRWRHNLTMLMRKRSSTFVINENINKYNHSIKKHKKFCHPVEVDIMIVV